MAAPLRVAVTGAAGRLGGAIARSVRADPRLALAATLDRCAGEDVGAEVAVVADLTACGAGGWARAFEGVDVVVHAAAFPGPAREAPPRTADAGLGASLEAAGIIGLEDEAPTDLLLANVASTARVLDAAARAESVRRVVLSSSAFAMGWSHDSAAFAPETLPLRDGFDAPRPRETYGLSKELGDAVGACYARATGLEVVALRFTNVVKREVFDTLPWTYDPKVPLVMWAWTHEDDVVDAHVAAATVPRGQLFAEAAEPDFESLLVCAPTTRYAADTSDLLYRHFGARAPSFSAAKNASVLCGARATRALRPWAPRCWSQRRGFASEAAAAARRDPGLAFHDLEGFELDCGARLPAGAALAYRVHGDPAGERVAVHPSSFGAVHTELEDNVDALLESVDCVVVGNMLGNGVSYSPADAQSLGEAYPPVVTIDDNARALRGAFSEALGGRETVIDVAYGYSMGAMQALALARLFPDDVRKVVAVCGAAGCADYNAVFLNALVAVLRAPGLRRARLEAFALVYAGWGVGYDFYAEKTWKRNHETLDAFLRESYVAGFKDDDPDDLLAMLTTWLAAPEDVPLEGVKADCLLLPCDTDRYFRLGEIRDRELAALPNATLRPIRSPYGHRAGDPWRPGMDAERAFIRDELRAFLR